MMSRFVVAARQLMARREGVSAAEYAILAVGVVIVVGAAVLTLADPQSNAFVILGDTILSEQSSLSNSTR